MFHDGMALVDIAKKLGQPEGTVRRWKSTQNWDGNSKKKQGERSQKDNASVRKRGGQPGNKNSKGKQNAKGHGAPKGTQNALKHGGYSAVYWDTLDEDERELIPYICYDCTKLATSVTSDYIAVGYSVADTQQSYKYISKLGYDPDNPSVRHGVEVDATSSTGYADGQYTEKLDQVSDTTRAWFSGGYLSNGTNAGRFQIGRAHV